MVVAGGALRAPAPAPAPSAALPQSYEALVADVAARRDVAFLMEMESALRLVRYAPGRIEFEPAPGAAPDFAARLGARLQSWTGQRWAISVVSEGGAPSLAEARAATDSAARQAAQAHPLVQAILDAFPGAKIAEARPASKSLAPPPEAEPGAALGEDWDPFEEG